MIFILDKERITRQRNRLGYVWFSENTKERKKNSFFMFGFIIEKMKENQI